MLSLSWYIQLAEEDRIDDASDDSTMSMVLSVPTTNRQKTLWRSDVTMTIVNLLCFAIISLNSGCTSPTSSPVNGEWISLELNGKHIYRIKTTQLYVYACALQSGLFRQSKSSLSSQWEYLGLQSSDTHIVGITDVVINPHDENELLASRMVLASNMPGIFKSLDGGRTWIEADSGYGFAVPWWFPADSGRYTSARVLFNPAGQFNVIFAGGQSDDGVYRSTNSGLTWQAVLRPNLNFFSQVNSFAQDPSNANIIYTGGSSSSGGASSMRPAWLIKSTNGVDAIWETLLPTLPDDEFFDNVVNNICIVANPKAIYLGMRGFVLGSKDEGKTWAKLITDPDHEWNIFTIAISPKDDRHLVAGNGSTFFESLDAGETWAKLRTPVSGLVGRLDWDTSTDNLYVVQGDSGGVYVLPNASFMQLRDLR